MRFISLDQKPAWFNNAGSKGTYAKKGGPQPGVKENFTHARQRYTIMTTVPSWAHMAPYVPPKLTVLFKPGVVHLDCFPPHLTEEVGEYIRSKGHVLLLIPGGTTPLTQVNDTNIHASMRELQYQDWRLPA